MWWSDGVGEWWSDGFRVSEDKGQREEENGKIPNHKNQMTNEYQSPINNDQNNCTTATQVSRCCFEHWNFGDWLLFGICNLHFVICF
ncbi:hypothetical protein D1AOALGA4SA_12942 [Olavius algarvensis Delta 1 endosymbiont]|nr:hypothetical protein D1AOALGA4SA_12942 [Olavius algarvensis Delta 1 endosymbiont]